MRPATGHCRLTARWVFPVDRPPLADGIVEIADGRISRLTSSASGEVISLGDVAILPGLVNPHVHLEFSGLSHPLNSGPTFANWIERVVASRRETGASRATSIRAGIEESLAAGVTTLGEITTSDDDLAACADGFFQGVSFRELIGLLPDRWSLALRTAEQHLESGFPAGVCPGLSPHAPYSVHPELYQRLIDLACEANVPVAVHLAETDEELELLQHGTGPLVEPLRRFGAWHDGLLPRGLRVMDYLLPLADVPRGLIIHGNRLDPEEVAWLSRQPHLSVVYCPRTHAAFGHPPHPWQALQAAGVRVALGTDGRASNPDLSLWQEARTLARQFPNADPENLLRMVTLAGAEALGLETKVGSLAPGKSADLVLLRWPADCGELDSPERTLLQTDDIVGVMRAGKWLLPPALPQD